MNVLPFVIAILMVLSYSAASLLQKHRASAHAQKAYLGLQRAERSFLQLAEQRKFKELPGDLVKIERETHPQPPKPRIAALPATNSACARLNLFPLALEGRERHPVLYEVAAKLLRTYYQNTLLRQGEEYKLLDVLLSAAKKRLEKQSTIPLETIELGDARLQRLYYLALKGTKRADVVSSKGYPPLLEAIKITNINTHVCLHHAHPNMLAGLFEPQIALELFRELHAEHGASIGLEGFQRRLAPRPPEFWKLLDYVGCKDEPMTLVANDEESGIAVQRELRK